jgi:hypothetical protein
MFRLMNNGQWSTPTVVSYPYENGGTIPFRYELYGSHNTGPALAMRTRPFAVDRRVCCAPRGVIDGWTLRSLPSSRRPRRRRALATQDE